MTGKRVGRRGLLKSGAAIGTAALGIPFLSGSAAAWKDIDIHLECSCVEYLGKLEVEDGEFRTEHESDLTAVSTNGPYVFEGPNGTRLQVTPTRVEEGEIKEFSFSVDNTLVTAVKVKGGPHSNWYYDEYSWFDHEYSREGPTVQGTGLHAPENASGNYAGVSHVEFWYCKTLDVTVTSTEDTEHPAQVIDVATHPVRLGVWWGPNDYSDQRVFEEGVEPIRAWLRGSDVMWQFSLPDEDLFIDDPTAVDDPSQMRAELLINQPSQGETWAGVVEL